VLAARPGDVVVSDDPFLAEAARVGRDIAGGALRSGGEATWLADEVAFIGGAWHPVLVTLGPDLARGTAGVGWFLARLAAIVDERALAAVATAALHHAVKRSEALISAGRLDWYRGASGVAWAAMDAGRALCSTELTAVGAKTAEAVVRAARGAPDGDPNPALIGGEAGNIAGLLALAKIGGNEAAAETASVRAAQLANTVPVASWAASPSLVSPSTISQAPPQPGAGLARGLSGIGLVLAATGWLEAAGRTFAIERALFEPGQGWVAPGAHAWLDSLAAPDASWCRGAAGIGLAHLTAGVALADLLLLAEAGAAVELVRGHLASRGGPDASLCHGEAGAIDLLATAGALLAEPIHTHAARTAGLALIEGAVSRGRYDGGFGARTRNPSLMFGLAGTATLLLRLHDHNSVPSPTLPPI
jgi:lantibiotic modifying enzyme